MQQESRERIANSTENLQRGNNEDYSLDKAENRKTKDQ